MESFFDHIYVINLDRRVDRWRDIQSQLRDAGITKAIRFSAIDKEPGCVGCFESHLAVLQTALDAGANNVLVLEDDATLYRDWRTSWIEGKRQIPNDWDMLYLGYNLDPAWSGSVSLVTPNILCLKDILTTHAYAVNGKYLAGLVETVKSAIGLGTPIDVVYTQQFINIKAYGIYPMLFCQASGFSDILGCPVDYHLRQNVDHVLAKHGQLL